MAHYAEIIDGKVNQVLVTDNEWTAEQTMLWLYTNISTNLWLKTSYNGNIRGKFAGVGDAYDPVLDIFIPPELVQEQQNLSWRDE